MVGRSLHRQGILDSVAELDRPGPVIGAVRMAVSLQPHGLRETSGTDSSEPPTDLVAHLFAELFPAGWSFIFGDIEPIEDVEFFKDRVTIARHRQDAQQFGRRPARAGDFPSAYRVGAIARCEATQLRHVCRGQGSADRIAEIHAKLFQLGAGHWGCFKLALPAQFGNFQPQRILHYQPAGKTSRSPEMAFTQ